MKIINHIVATASDKISELNRPLRDIDSYIQAGSALTDTRIGQYQDNTGDNISYRNRQYCELTALYWIWKNQKADYYGLEHYRRAFKLTAPEITDIISDGIDAIIPQKVVMNLSVKEQYYINACNDTWFTMMDVLKNKDSLTYECARIIFDKNILFPFNMGIFSDKFLNDYCGWLFPILEDVVAICGEKWDVYQNRYPGFLSERLFTLFYFMNYDKYRFYEAPVIMYSAPKSQDFSEEYIINHTVDLLKAKKSFPAYAYISHDVPAEIINHSPILKNLYELAILVKEEGLKRGDVYLTRECSTLEDYMKVHNEAFRRKSSPEINVALYSPSRSDSSIPEDTIRLYNSVIHTLSGLPLNIVAFLHDTVCNELFDFDSRMHTDINNILHLYRTNMISAIIFPEYFSGSQAALSFLITRGVDTNDLYIMKNITDSCNTADDVAELIEPFSSQQA